MAAEYKRKWLQYRRAAFLNPSSEALEALLKKTLKKRHKVKTRLEELSGDHGTHRFINTNRNQIGMVFGSFVLYTQGMNRPLVKMELEKDELTLEQIAPPKADGFSREFLDSMFYFGCKDDHVVLLQSASLKARDFENHLGWLFGKAEVLEDNQVVLEETLPNVTQEKIRKSHVKKLRFGQAFETKPAEPAEKQGKQRFRPVGSAFRILGQVLGPDWVKDLELKDSLDQSRLELILEVRYSYDTTDSAQALIDNIATSMRHIDKEDLEIKLKTGGRIRSDELKVTSPINVRTYGGVIDESDLYPKMHEFLAAKIEEGVVEP